MLEIKHLLIIFISVCARLFSFAIFIRVIMSFLRGRVQGRFFEYIYEVTEPPLAFVRRYIPPIGGVLDISPIVIFFAIDFVSGVLIQIIGRAL